jgi:hypothetical protein
MIKHYLIYVHSGGIEKIHLNMRPKPFKLILKTCTYGTEILCTTFLDAIAIVFLYYEKNFRLMIICVYIKQNYSLFNF